MKRFLLLLALPLLCVLAVQASDYGINVGGVEVSTSNYNNVTGKDINSGATVKYDPTNKVLTLSGLNMTRTGGSNYAVHNRSVSGLTIKFVGSNTFKTVGAGLKLMESTDIIVDGTSSYAYFTCTGTSDNQNGMNISSGKTVNISGTGKIQFYTSGSSSCKEGVKGGGSSTKINLKSSITMTVHSAGTYGISSLSLCSYDGSKLVVVQNGAQSFYQCYWSSYNKAAVLAPVGAYYSNGTIYTSSGSPVTRDNIEIHSDYAFIVNSSNFPDANFRSYLLNLYPKGYLTSSEVSSRTNLTMNNKGITNMKGVELFTSLTKLDFATNSVTKFNSMPSTVQELNCSSNQLTSLPTLPSGLTRLTCYSNQLTSLPTIPSNIEYINAGYNKFTNINIRSKSKLRNVYLDNCSSLATVDLSNNALTYLYIYNSPAITSLAVGSNQLTELSNIPTSIEYLQISNNQFTSFEITNHSKLKTLFANDNPYLKTLNCSYNAIESLYLSNCTQLWKLDCRNNNITSLGTPPSSLQEIYAGSNKFSYFTLTGNSNLKTLDLRSCTSMTSVNCSNNALTTLTLTGCTALSTVNCYSNQLTSLGTLPSSIKTLDCHSNKLTSLGTPPSSLVTLNCSYNQLTSLPTMPSTIQEINAGSNKLTSLSVTGKTALKTLNVSNNANMTSLYCQSNALTSLNMSDCPAITSLNCSSNQLTSLSTMPSTIQEINASSNKLTTLSVTGKTALKTLNVSNNANMTSLYCQNNALTSLNVSDCSALKSLNCSSNQLTSLGTVPTNIEEIYCGNNKFTELVIKNYPYLKTLNVDNCSLLYSLVCERNALTSLSYSGCPLTNFSCVTNQLTSLPTMPSTIEVIYCGDNKFTTLSITGYPNLNWLEVSSNHKLTKLECYENALTYLRVSNCTSLETLDCSENLLASDRFKSTNFANCPAIKYFDCSNNALETLDVSACSNLQTLDCYYNNLTSLNVEGLAKLTKIDCGINSLSSLSLSGCNALTELVVIGNQIKEAAMTALVASLRTIPEGENGALYVLDSESDDNVFTDEHITAARAKRWIPYKDAPNGWEELVATPTYNVGDVDGNGEVNGNDLNKLINILLGIEQADTYEGRANVDGEGGVDGNDLNLLINILLGKVVFPDPDPFEVQMFTVNGVSFYMIPVEGGTFQMGSSIAVDDETGDNEEPRHEVTLSNFYICSSEVSQALWQAVMGSNPSSFNSNNLRPVECVSWDDCQTFITKLNQMTGKTFRLPTEAEWEYAAHGGNLSKGYKYSGSSEVGEVAWYSSNSSNTTHLIATQSPNELDLYDMSGNVCEWCSDWYDFYSSGAQTNPTGPSTTPYGLRVYRGGHYQSSAIDCRITARHGKNPSFAGPNLGLRLAM